MSDTYTPPKSLRAHATSGQSNALTAYLFDGNLTADGKVINFNRHNELTYGPRSSVDQSYWRFIDWAGKYANVYPTHDPAVWLPLAKAGLDPTSPAAKRVADYSAELQAATGGLASNHDAATNDAQDPSTQDRGGLTGMVDWVVAHTIGQGAQDVATATDAVDRFTSPVTDTLRDYNTDVGHAVNNASPPWLDKAASWTADRAQRGIDLGYGSFKGIVRQAFTAASMPQQAVIAGLGTIEDDISKGDYAGALLHAYGANPIMEASAIGVENLTGSDFYRSHGPTIWSQTDEGQQILDLTGQGRGEQLGLYDDKPGLQSDQGSGFFINQNNTSFDTSDPNAPSTIGQWERAVRLQANTIQEASPLTDQQQKAFKEVARLVGGEAAIDWAVSQGFSWDDSDQQFLRPAQAWTPGRGLAMVFTDPNTKAYNTISGLTDFVADIALDPTMYIPGGQVRELGTAIRAGESLRNIGSWDNIVIGLGKTTHADADAVEAIRKTGLVPLARDGWGVKIVSKDGTVLGTEKQLLNPIDDAFVKHSAGHNIEDVSSLDSILAAGHHIELSKPANVQMATAAETKAALDEAELVGQTLTGQDAVDLVHARGWDDLKTSGYTMTATKDGEAVDVNQVLTPLDRTWQTESENLSPLDKLLASGHHIELSKPSLKEMVKNTGGVMVTQRVWDQMLTGKLARAVTGIAQWSPDDPWGLWNALGRKVDKDTARALAKATTEAEVRHVLAPTLGIRFRGVNDLTNVMVDVPRYSVSNRLWRATDGYAIKKRAEKIPGMSIMPVKEVDRQDWEAIMTNLENWINVVTGRRVGARIASAMDDSAVMKAINRMFDIDSQGSKYSGAQTFQYLYGTKGERTVLNADGDPLMEAKSFQAKLDEGMDEPSILAQHPPGSHIDYVGVDGVMTEIERYLVRSEAEGGMGMSPHAAHQITRFISDSDHQIRYYSGDGLANRVPQTWEVGEGSLPLIEADFLGGAVQFPDAGMARKLASWHGKKLTAIAEAGGSGAKRAEAVLAADDYLSAAMWQWKAWTLMQGGVRLPAYVMRTVSDGLVTMMFNGNVSLVRKPADFIGLVLTSALRKAVLADPDHKAVVAKMGLARAASDNPLARMMIRDKLLTDITGEGWEVPLQKWMAGDPDANDELWKALNASVGVRGARNMDVLYQYGASTQVARRMDRPQEWKDYVEGLATWLHRYSQDELARRLANVTNGDYAATKAWFTSSIDSPINSLRVNPQLRAQFGKTVDPNTGLDGIDEYLRAVRDQITIHTGNVPELLKLISDKGMMTVTRDGKKMRVSMLEQPSRGSPHRVVRSDVGTLLNEIRHRTDGVDPSEIVHIGDGDHVRVRTAAAVDGMDGTLPPAVLTEKAGPGRMNKEWWNNWNRRLFALAGSYEDRWVREPAFRDFYRKEVLRLKNLIQPGEKEKVIALLDRTGSHKLAAQMRKATGEGPFTAAEIDRVAKHRAQQNILDITYDAANRREWAYAARFISPFAQAAVNGMYRWTKAAILNPESTYRIVKIGQFLSGPNSAAINQYLGSGTPGGTPFFYEDPRTRQRVFAFPLLGAAASRLGEMMGLHDLNMAFQVNANQALNMGFPSFENEIHKDEATRSVTGKNQSNKDFWTQVVFPGFGPVLTVPAELFTDSARGFAADYFFPYGQRGGDGVSKISNILFPGTIGKLLNQMGHGTDEEMALAARKVEFTYMLARQQGGWAQLSDDQRRDVTNRASFLANAFRVMEIGSAVISPTAPYTSVSVEAQGIKDDLKNAFRDSEDIPSHFIYAKMAKTIFHRYTDEMQDYGKAEAAFVSDMGLDSLLLLAPSGTDSDAAPPTYAAARLHDDYRYGYDKYRPVLSSIMVNRDGSDFDEAFYSDQIASGEIVLLPFEERVKIASQRLLTYVHSHWAGYVRSLDLSPLQKDAAMNDVGGQMEDMGWTNTYAVRSPQERNQLANLMLQAARDPHMTPYIGGRTQRLLAYYLIKRDELVKGYAASSESESPDLASATVSAGGQRDYLYGVGSQFAQRDAGFNQIWWLALRSEVTPGE